MGMMNKLKLILLKFLQMCTQFAFTITIHEAEARKQVTDKLLILCACFNEETGEELIRYDLGEDFPHETAIVPGSIS